jgi:hypothetical protein
LHAGNASNATFAGWGGDTDGACDTGPECVVTMDGARTVTAHYDPILHHLAVTTSGAGSGTVTSLPPNDGIDCGVTCETDVQQGSSVTLHAAADDGSIFAGWDGDCSGRGACTASMDTARNVDARFEPGFDLHVVASGDAPGTVTSDVGGIDCGTTCDAGIAADSIVTLHAGDAPNATFAGWRGDTDGACPGMDDCVVTMDRERTVRAVYEPILQALTVTIAGPEAGTVTSLPPNEGIDCGTSCTASFQQGSTVTLHATAGAQAVFAGWSGDTQVDEETGSCLGSLDCTLPIDRARSVTATFQAVVPDTTLADADPAVTYNGWVGVAEPAASGGAYRVSATKNDTMTWVSPSSTSVSLIAHTGPGAGKAAVTIDGKNKGTVDLYAASPGSTTTLYSGLVKKAHTLVIKVLGAKNAASTGTGVGVDAFRAGAATVQESDPKVRYDTWKAAPQTKATDGTYRSATGATATATVTFTGTSIDWVTTVGKAFGQATVSIDGVSRGTIDLYQPATVWQSNVTFRGLTPGSHTLVIHVLGHKNAWATATKVVLDGFIVHG